MTCNEFERLADAYLDRELSGSLRIEFDTHRLRCQHCQQQVAMMQAIESTLGSDGDVPPLSDNFTGGVMEAIERQQPASRRLFGTRVAVVGGMMLQAAAVLAFAILWQPSTAAPDAADQPARVANATSVDAFPPLAAEKKDYVAVHDLVVTRIQGKLEQMRDAGETFGADLTRMAQYMNVTLPDNVAAASTNMVQANVWKAWWPAPAGEESTPSESDAAASDELTLQTSL